MAFLFRLAQGELVPFPVEGGAAGRVLAAELVPPFVGGRRVPVFRLVGPVLFLRAEIADLFGVGLRLFRGGEFVGRGSRQPGVDVFARAPLIWRLRLWISPARSTTT